VFLLRSLRSGRTLADLVTTLRFMGLVAWLWLVPAPLGPWTWGAAVAIAAADLLDGAVARRFGSARHGALLDMETDQFVVLGFALAVVAGGGGVHVLVLPALRYGFVLAAWRLRLPANDPRPVRGDNRRGRFVCAAVVIGSLIALHPAVPRAAANVITAIAVLLLTWSFAGDARFLLAHRAGRAA
jgi:phosphatidylglycerophosphate synthase